MTFIYTTLISLGLIPNKELNVFDVSVQLNHLVILGLIMFSVPLLFYDRPRKIAQKIYVLFSLILLWAFVTTLFKDYVFEYKYVLQPLLSSWLILTLAFVYSKVVCFKNINHNKLLITFSYFLSSVFVLYALWFSFDFSFEYSGRLKGPLGNAATIQIAMLPVLSVHLGNLFLNKVRTLPLLATIITFLTIILTGSRIALLSLIILIILVVLNDFSGKRLLILCFVSIVSMLFIINYGDIDRFQSFDDSLRKTNFETSLQISTQNASSFILGQGYGTVWPWYFYENGPTNILLFGNMIDHYYGKLLYHAHSLFLAILTELGFIAFFLFVLILIMILKEYVKIRKGQNMEKYLMMGILATIPSLVTDLFLLKNWNVSFVWLLFLFYVFSVQSKQLEHTAS